MNAIYPTPFSVYFTCTVYCKKHPPSFLSLPQIFLLLLSSDLFFFCISSVFQRQCLNRNRHLFFKWESVLLWACTTKMHLKSHTELDFHYFLCSRFCSSVSDLSLPLASQWGPSTEKRVKAKFIREKEVNKSGLWRMFWPLVVCRELPILQHYSLWSSQM